jgi:protocatechuate 3,4-dioxygenase beta subunit
VQPGGTAWIARGRAHRGRENPYPNARIRVQVFPGYAAEGEPTRAEVITADRSGTFTWSMPPPDRTLALSFQSADPNAWSMTQVFRALPGDPPPEPFDIWILPYDARVVGSVRDVEGRPLPGAQVRSAFASEPVACDLQGTFELPVSSGSGTTRIYAMAPGCAVQRGIVTVDQPGAEARLDFTLHKEFRIVGRITDEEGHPVAGAEVRTFMTMRTNLAVSDANGNYVLTQLDRGRPRHDLFARHRDFVEAKAQVSTAGDEVRQNLVLKRGVCVTGRVVDAEGEPIPGASLFLGFSASAYNRLDALARDEGKFVFPCVEPGSHTLVTHRRGHAPDIRTLEIPGGTDSLDGVVVELGPPHFVEGKVVDAAGKPLPEVYVSVRHRSMYLDVRTRTDAEGCFRVDSLPAEPVRLEFYAASRFRRLTEEGVAVDRSDYVFMLQRAAGLAGRVVDGTTGAPLRVFSIRLVDPVLAQGEARGSGYGVTWMREGHRFSREDGVWRTDDEQLEPGTVFGVEARAEGYAPTVNRHVVAVVDPDPDRLVLRMLPGTTLTGRVLAAEGEGPVVGAVVKLFSREQPLRSEGEDTYGRPRALTESDGSFRLPHVPDGQYSLAVESPGHPTTVDGPFAVPGEPREIRLVHGGRISGSVRDAAGAAIAGASVRLYARDVPGETGRSRSVTTDAAGAFAFDGLASGLWNLAHVIGTGQKSEVRILARTVRLKAPAQATVRLGPTGSATVGGVVESDGELPTGLVVHLAPDGERLPEDRPAARAALSKEGRFEFRGVEPGIYWLQAAHGDAGTSRWRHARKQVVVAEGETQRVVLRLR